MEDRAHPAAGDRGHLACLRTWRPLDQTRLYQRQQVATYWVVDLDARLVEVWHPGDTRPEIVTDILRWRVAPDREELMIELEDLWR